ncbi:hypothetical protein EMIT019CA3_150062 [Bacillus pseudomycoides]
MEEIEVLKSLAFGAGLLNHVLKILRWSLSEIL